MATAGQTQAADTADGNGGFGRGGCGADELKDLLATLSTQIADADRRHSEAIREMHERLARIGSHSETLKVNLPPSYASVFSRIEEGMTELATRLASSAREPATQVPPPLPWQLPSSLAPPVPAPAELPHGEHSVSLANVVRALQAGTHAPAEAALPALAQPMHEAPVVAAPAPLEASAAANEEPWDDNAAAALVELYDSGEPGLPPPPVEAAAAPHETLDSAPIAAPESDRTWLEGKLADVAARVEQSLMELKPESSLLALGERFEKFEQHFTGVLGEVATRSDVEGLRLVEAHIAELSQQIEHAHAQLARLDSIETQFGELRNKLTDEHIVDLFGSLVPTEDDLTRFAEDAAVRVADRVVAKLPASETPPAEFAAVDHSGLAAEIEERTGKQISELQEMLSSLIAERRRDEASKTEALETVQLGMQQLLDRVEAMEASAANAAATPPPSLAQQAPTQPIQDMAPPVRGIGEGRLAATRPLEMAPAAATPPVTPRTFAEEAKAAAARAAAGGSRPAQRSEPRGADAGRPTPAGLAEAMRGAGEPVGEGGRDQFLVLARQAAEKAQAAARVQAAPPAQAPKPAALKDRLFGAASGNGPASKGGVRPGMLIAATVAAFVLTGYFFVSGPKFRQSPAQVQRAAPGAPGTPVPDRDEAPAAQPGAPAAPDAARHGPAGKDGAGLPGPIEGPKRQSSNTSDSQDEFARAQTGSIVAPDAQTLAEAGAARPVTGGNGLIGITVQNSQRQMNPEEVMRARQRAHLANLSERTAENAARSSAMPEAAVPAAVRSSVPDTTGSIGDERGHDLPPLQIGPSSLRQAAAKGDASAQFEIAARFAEGKGVDQNFEQAAVWYQRAAAQGLVQAQYRLATLYERGLGMKSDLNRARAWYKRAADQGNVKAMHNLAVLSTGKDQAPDYQTAALWFTAAADRGLVDSQYNLGILYESGLGVEKDLSAAYKWYHLAANGGDKDASRRRDLVKPKLDQASLRRTQEDVQLWRPLKTDAMANEPRVAGEAWKKRADAQ